MNLRFLPWSIVLVSTICYSEDPAVLSPTFARARSQVSNLVPKVLDESLSTSERLGACEAIRNSSSVILEEDFPKMRNSCEKTYKARRSNDENSGDREAIREMLMDLLSEKLRESKASTAFAREGDDVVRAYFAPGQTPEMKEKAIANISLMTQLGSKLKQLPHDQLRLWVGLMAPSSDERNLRLCALSVYSSQTKVARAAVTSEVLGVLDRMHSFPTVVLTSDIRELEVTPQAIDTILSFSARQPSVSGLAMLWLSSHLNELPPPQMALASKKIMSYVQENRGNDDLLVSDYNFNIVKNLGRKNPDPAVMAFLVALLKGNDGMAAAGAFSALNPSQPPTQGLTSALLSYAKRRGRSTEIPSDTIELLHALRATGPDVTEFILEFAETNPRDAIAMLGNVPIDKAGRAEACLKKLVTEHSCSEDAQAALKQLAMRHSLNQQIMKMSLQYYGPSIALRNPIPPQQISELKTKLREVEADWERQNSSSLVK